MRNYDFSLITHKSGQPQQPGDIGELTIRAKNEKSALNDVSRYLLAYPEIHVYKVISHGPVAIPTSVPHVF
jgi:hypothetical protein